MSNSIPTVFVYGKCPCCDRIITIPSGTNKTYCCYCGSQFLSSAAIKLYGLKEMADITSNFKVELEEELVKVKKEMKAQKEKPESPPLPRMMSITQLCKATGVSTSYIRRLVKEGKVPAFYTGKKALINYNKFCEMLDSLE